MSQSRASLINTTLSLMVVDATAMPPNLGHSQREDYPESLFRVVAYDGKNILPTALGYRSHFSEQTLFELPACPSKYLQAILVYQGADYAVRMIALAEEGAWVINATEGQVDSQWTRIFNSGYDPTALIRHQWSWAVVANQLYIYQQGQPAFYAICTPSYYTNNLAQTTIPKAKITSVLTNGGYGILKIIPSFLNMAGQVGIYRADTRLGFWDSDNSVSWSSATQVYDFTPSTTSFAGNTKFADVVGKISKVLGQGDGFIIYAARSIVRVVPTGSNELWSGSALLSDAGVAFDSQACASQPDDTHYALTGSGLYQITGAQVQPIEVEVSDYIMENSLVYACDVVDARYLFIHSDKDLIPSHYDVTNVVPDLDGNLYDFKPAVPPTSATTASDLITSALDGSSPTTQDDFSLAAEEIKPVIVKPSNKAIIPCWTGDGLSTNFDESLIPNGSSDQMQATRIELESSILDGETYLVDVKMNRPLFINYYYNEDDHFIDKAAEDMQTALAKTFDLVKKCQDVSLEAIRVFTSAAEFTRIEGSNAGETDRPYGYIATTVLSDEPSLRWNWRNVLGGADGAVSKSSCALSVDGLIQSIQFKTTVTMTELVEPYYIIESARSSNGIHIGYSSSWQSFQNGLADVSIPTPHVTDAKYVFLHGGDLPGVGGMLLVNEAASLVATALFNDGFGVGDIVPYEYYIDDSNYKLYIGTQGHGQSQPSIGEVFGVGIHSALGGAIGTSYVNTENSFDPPQQCGDPTTVDSPMYTNIPGYAGSMFQGAAIGSSYDYIGRQDGSECIPMAQVTRARTNAIYVTGLTHTGLGALDYFTSKAIDMNDAEVVQAINKLKKKVSLQFLEFQIIHETNPLTDPQEVFRAEISGYGYQPSGGYSFRKTHNRSDGAPCLGGSGTITRPADPGDSDTVTKPIDTEIGETPVPGKWTYPQPIPRPPISALFQIGTPAPFYPSYHSAIVYDLHYKKWGRYDNEHQVIFGTLPTNRVDHTVVPVVDKGIRGGAFRASDKVLTFFTPDNSNSMIAYGKIGKSREGVTQSTKVVAHFAKPATGNIIVELSRDGITIDEASSLYIPLNSVLSVSFPFTETAKWFNIRLEGQFDLTYLEFESAATGRR